MQLDNWLTIIGRQTRLAHMETENCKTKKGERVISLDPDSSVKGSCVAGKVSSDSQGPWNPTPQLREKQVNCSDAVGHLF